MANSSELEEKLAALQMRFQRRLTETVATIERWDTDEYLDELREIVHKLAGTAGTYGYKNLSETMRLLEIEIKNVLAGECHCDARQLYQKAAILIKNSTKEN